MDKKISAYELSEVFFDTFLSGKAKCSIRDYLDNSYYDESGIFDLNDDTIKLIDHVENKYYAPLIEHSYTRQIKFFLDNCVHPDDYKIAKDLLDPKTVMANLKNSKTPNFRFAHFRIKLQSGEYRYVEEVLITGQEYDVPKNTVLFYIYDINNSKSREVGQTNDESFLFDRNRDNVTNLYNRDIFYKKVDAFLKGKKNLKDYVFVAIDIENFKLFDEWYGRENGDQLLARIGTILRDKANNNRDGVAGYFGSDLFAILMKYNKQAVERIYNKIRQTIISYGFSVGFMPCMGIAYVTDGINIRDSIKKAIIAKDNTKSDPKEFILFYDHNASIVREQEYHLFLDCMNALNNGEITFYLQPQVRASTGKIVGAEALARWIKKDGTIVSPGIFIPLLEKYGFIADLDQYIWRKTVEYIRSLVEAQITPVPISINVSYKDIITIDIVDYFAKLLNEYKIDPKYLKVEITESSYADKSIDVAGLINNLEKLGLMVLMDDFGSGYSSLNMLSSLTVDAIKLDSMFLSFNDNTLGKGVHILESVVSMAKNLSLPIIMEGVEDEKQLKFLMDLGVRYIQGFYFYKPMPIPEMTKLLLNEENIDRNGFVAHANEQFRLREFLDATVYSDAMLNNILGPVAFYSAKGKRVDIVRFNEQFYKAVNVPDFSERLEHIEQFTPGNDRNKLYAAIKKAKEDRLNGASDIIRFYRTDGSMSYFLIRFYFIGSTDDGSDRYYGSATDITDLASLQSKMVLLEKYSSDTIILLKTIKEDGKWDFDIACHGLAEYIGLDVNDLKEEFNNYKIFERIVDKDVQEMKEIILYQIKNQKDVVTTTFSIKRDDGKVVKIFMRADPVQDESTSVEYILNFRQYYE